MYDIQKFLWARLLYKAPLDPPVLHKVSNQPLEFRYSSRGGSDYRFPGLPSINQQAFLLRAFVNGSSRLNWQTCCAYAWLLTLLSYRNKLPSVWGLASQGAFYVRPLVNSIPAPLFYILECISSQKPEWNCYCEQLPPWSQTLSSLLAFCMGINPINNSIVSQKSNQLRGPGRNNEQQCTSLELEVDQELGRGELRWGAYRGFYIIPQMPARDTAIASNWGLCAEVGLST